MNNLTPGPFPGRAGVEEGKDGAPGALSHPPRGVVRGQLIAADKHGRAKELRTEMTQEERLLWDVLRANRLHGFLFRRHQIINGFIVDFYCDAAALAIEVDGSSHGGREEYDQERDTVLRGQGIDVLRFSTEQIHQDMSGVITQVAQHVTSRLPTNLPRSLPSQARDLESGSDFSIQLATVEEAQALSALINQHSFKLEGGGALLPTSAERIAGIIADPKQGTFFAAVNGSELVGCVAVVAYQAIAELRSLVVEPSQRGSGLGAELVQTALDEAKRLGFSHLYAFVNARALPLFERHGFKAAPKPPQKLLRECNHCPIQTRCAEVSVVADLK